MYSAEIETNPEYLDHKKKIIHACGGAHDV